MRVKLIADSASDLPKWLCDKYDIDILPLKVIFSDGDYYDGEELSSEDFFKKIKEMNEVPKTSQVTPNQFMNAFEKYKDYDHVLCFTLASVASGTYQSANLAMQEYDDVNIHLIDSESLSMGEGLLVLKVAQLLQDGQSVESVLSQIDEIKSKIGVYFTVDSLNFLKKGGRIKGTEAFIGELLKIKPILRVEDGITKPFAKVRSMKKAIENMATQIDGLNVEMVVVAHGDGAKSAEKLQAELEKKIPEGTPLYTANVGATIGAHAGPGIIGYMFIEK